MSDTLARVRRRVAASRVLSIVCLDLLIALSAYAGYLVVAWVFLIEEHSLLALLLVLSLWAAATAIRSLLGARVSCFDAAVIADERLRLKERVSTAVHAERHPESLPAPEWGELIRRDGARSLTGSDIQASFPVRPPRIARWTLAPAALAVLIAFLPPLDILGLRQDRRVDARMRREVEKKRDELARALAELRKEAEKPPDPEVEKALEALLKRPQETNLEKKDQPPRLAGEELKKDAMVSFTRLEEALRRELDRSQLNHVREFLDRFPPGSMGRTLTAGLRDALKAGEFSKALAELKKLEDQLLALDQKKMSGALSKEDLERLKKLSDELSRLGKDSAMLSRLSSAFSGTGGALTAGDFQRALEGLQGLEKELKSLEQMLDDLKFLEKALELAQLSMEELGKLHKCPNCGKVSQDPGGT